MSTSEITCWTLIQAAAQGNRGERDQFAQRYLGSVRAYLQARWGNSAYRHLVDDAVQDVFVECFRTDGALCRLDANRSGTFRAYLYGVVRNVALRIESRQATELASQHSFPSDLDGVVSDESTLSQVFDRAWAKSIMRQAGQRHEELARAAGEEALQRFELLRLRFEEDLPIREIAQHWNVDAAVLHRAYRKAREEFRAALIEVVRFHLPGSDAEVDREAAALLALLA
jgi:RNA polymerase sigma-70 factor (ECF subfamily)